MVRDLVVLALALAACDAGPTPTAAAPAKLRDRPAQLTEITLKALGVT